MQGGANILVVRLGAMGDIVHALPAVAALKRAYPEGRITWVTEPRWAALLAGNPAVDRIVHFDRGTAASLGRFWRELRTERFDFAIDFQGLMKSALVARVARAERIFGFDSSVAREPAAALFYTDREGSAAVHRVDRNLELAARAGAAEGRAMFWMPAGRAEGSLPEGPFVLASPLGGWRSKQWPLEYYGQLAEILRRETGLPLVLNGPAAERATLEAVTGARVHLSSIEGLIDATRRAAAVVGLDSGPMHVAAALGKPGVAIFGPTDPAQTGPYGGSLAVLRDAAAETTYKRRSEIDASMRAVTAAQVGAALMAQLAGAAPARVCGPA